MLSPRLYDFLATWADAESDPEDVIEPLNEQPVSDWAVWLKDDMRGAIMDNELTPRAAQAMTGLALTSEEDIARWLRGLWKTWFPDEPVPAV